MTPAERRRDRAQRAARYRAAGWSLRQIARRIKVSEATVRADLLDAPPPLRPWPQPAPFSGDWRAEAERLRASGHPNHKNSQAMPHWMIADLLAVDEADVRRHFARLRRRDQRASNVASLSAGGLSLRQVATALGISEATVRRDLRRAPVVRHLPARQRSEIPMSVPGPVAGSTHPDDAPGGAVIPMMRRTAR